MPLKILRYSLIKTFKVKYNVRKTFLKKLSDLKINYGLIMRAITKINNFTW